MAEAAKLGEKNWYIINTYSMHEQKTADNIRKRIASMGMENEIFRVLVVEVDVFLVVIVALPGKGRLSGQPAAFFGHVLESHVAVVEFGRDRSLALDKPG